MTDWQIASGLVALICLAVLIAWSLIELIDSLGRRAAHKRARAAHAARPQRASARRQTKAPERPWPPNSTIGELLRGRPRLQVVHIDSRAQATLAGLAPYFQQSPKVVARVLAEAVIQAGPGWVQRRDIADPEQHLARRALDTFQAFRTRVVRSHDDVLVVNVDLVTARGTGKVSLTNRPSDEPHTDVEVVCLPAQVAP